MPGEERRRRCLEQSVGELSEYGEGEDGTDDLVGLAELLPVDEQVAEAFGRAHEFGGDHEHPSQAEPLPQAHDIGGQNRRQQNAPHELRRGEPEDAADFDRLAIDRLDRAEDPEIDREEAAHCDQRNLRLLEDSEP